MKKIIFFELIATVCHAMNNELESAVFLAHCDSLSCNEHKNAVTALTMLV